MKKLITLCLAIITATSLLAQSRTTNEARGIIQGDRDDDRWERVEDRNFDNSKNRNHNYSDAYKRKAEAINRYYNEQISDVRSAKRLSRQEKARIIDSIEDRRRQALAELRRDVAFNNKKNHRNRDWNDRRNNRRF